MNEKNRFNLFGATVFYLKIVVRFESHSLIEFWGKKQRYQSFVKLLGIVDNFRTEVVVGSNI